MDSVSTLRKSNLAVASVGAMFAIIVVSVVFFPRMVSGIGSSPFLPHAYCYLYDKQLLTLHLACDIAIFLSYVTISLTLGYLVYRSRREIPFRWMFVAFGVFIIACGFTHFMEAVVLWKPLYWLSGDIKLVTALASVLTAVALPSLVPDIKSMAASVQVSEQRKQQLEETNAQLEKREMDLESEIQVRAKAEEQLSHLSARLLHLQDEERRRVARDLHDSTGQTLVALKMMLASLKPFVAHHPQADDLLKNLNSYADQSLQEIRATSHLLHPPLLDEVGFSSAAQWYLEGFGERTGIETKLDLSSLTLNKDSELVFFRILQESLTNVFRHSGSKAVHIRFYPERELAVLAIRDYGRGVPSETLANFEAGAGMEVGVGLAGMKQRVRELGGQLAVESDGTGTCVTAKLPLLSSENLAKSDSDPVQRMQTPSGH